MITRNPIPCYYPDPHLPIRVIQHRGTFEHDAYPVHVHQDVTWEFCYVVRGQVTAMLRGTPRRLGPGEVLMFRPDDVHGFDAWTGKHITLMFQQQVLSRTPLSVSGRRSARLEMDDSTLLPHLTVAPQRRPIVEHMLELLRQEGRENHPLSDTMSHLLLAQLLLEWMRNGDPGSHAIPAAPVSAAARETIEQFCGELRANLDHPWTLTEMVRRSGYGTSQLTRLFREVTSLSPCAWLGEERIRRARDLLAQSDKKITEIAQEVGFGTCCHFARVFSRAMGTSPREYREAMRQRQ